MPRTYPPLFAKSTTERTIGERLAIAPARQLFDRFVEVFVELPAQGREIGAARRQDPFAVRVVQERVEQVFERQVRVPARDRLAVRDMEDRFDGC